MSTLAKKAMELRPVTPLSTTHQLAEVDVVGEVASTKKTGAPWALAAVVALITTCAALGIANLAVLVSRPDKQTLHTSNRDGEVTQPLLCSEDYEVVAAAVAYSHAMCGLRARRSKSAREGARDDY